ncbi:hypothetical protein EYF80_034655 [Liparis tanakae]|uniref:Uncharacterized protein n=1 Tax=Liparis tanakae TaxID=230148 RepID=A0A4Z2GPC4_9TELE|nr:hypothetical protein EYF80_034655 [Liparis tanakae]
MDGETVCGMTQNTSRPQIACRSGANSGNVNGMERMNQQRRVYSTTKAELQMRHAPSSRVLSGQVFVVREFTRQTVQSMLAMETLSEGWRDAGREEERVMVRISIPQCWSALLQSLRGMGLGMERGGEARGREALL